MEHLFNFILALGLVGCLGLLVTIGVNFMLKPTYLFMDAKTGKLFETKKAFHQLPETQQVKRFKYIGIL